VYDSIRREDISSRVKKQICALVYSDAKEINLTLPNVPRRVGSKYGMFGISSAISFSTGFDPADLCYN